MAAWDVDSIDVAVRTRDGSVTHPAGVLIR
jgi:hypothetical protein